MPDAIGIPEDMLRKAASMAVCKINVDSDIRIAMTAAIREHFAENPTHFDPRQYLTPARNLIEEVVAHKIDVVFGSTGHAKRLKLRINGYNRAKIEKELEIRYLSTFF